MKIKRNKQAKKILTFYKRNFGLREPFQVIGINYYLCVELKSTYNTIA